MQPEEGESKLTSVAQRDDGGNAAAVATATTTMTTGDVDGAANGSRDLKTSCSKIRLPSRRGGRGEVDRGDDEDGGREWDGPGSGNGGASSDWSGREEIASRLVIITPLTQLPSPPIALPIIFVIEPLRCSREIAFLGVCPGSFDPSTYRAPPSSSVVPPGHTRSYTVLLHAQL